MRVHAILASALLSNVAVAAPVKRDGSTGTLGTSDVSKCDDFLELGKAIRDGGRRELLDGIDLNQSRQIPQARSSHYDLVKSHNSILFLRSF